MSQAQERDDLQLSDYTGTLRRRWWLILLCAAVGLVGAVGYYKTAHKEYIATATVYVTGSSGTTNEVANGRTSGTVNLDTEAQVVQSAAVAQGAAKLMHVTVPLQQLINRVSVTVPANSQVLSISCQESSAVGAATCAQSFAQAFLTYSSTTTIASANQQISALQAKIANLQSSAAKLSVEVASLPDNSPQRATAQQQLGSDNSQLSSLNNQVAQLIAELTNPSAGSILSAATPPSSASSPKKLLILASGLLLGFVGLVLAFVLDRRDRRILGPRDLAGIDVPVLMNPPLTRSAADVAIVAPRSPLGREFTGLTHVLTGSLGTGSHVILVTGARPGHGASMVAANLAVALSRNQPDVTLICADLEDSVYPAMVGLPYGPGLTELLAGDAQPGDALANWWPSPPVCGWSGLVLWSAPTPRTCSRMTWSGYWSSCAPMPGGSCWRLRLSCPVPMLTRWPRAPTRLSWSSRRRAPAGSMCRAPSRTCTASVRMCLASLCCPRRRLRHSAMRSTPLRASRSRRTSSGSPRAKRAKN